MSLSDEVSPRTAPAVAAQTCCTVRIALGSNLGERAEQLRQARARLEQEGWVTQQRCSSVLETAPVGPPQPHYLNQVIVGVTRLAAAELLRRVKALEVELGRVPGPRWGARCIDIDLLDMGGEVVDIPGLQLPHPEIPRRSFVLEPWSQVEPDYRLPGETRSIRELWHDGLRSGVWQSSRHDSSLDSSTAESNTGSLQEFNEGELG